MIAIIGGSGLTTLKNLTISKRQVVRTPYGNPSDPLVFGQLFGVDIVFLARHGINHSIAPHKINYRANIWALYKCQVSTIIAVGAVGSINANLKPGDVLIPAQIIDYTYGREHTFFDGCEGLVEHIDFTKPFDERMRRRLLSAMQSTNHRHLAEYTYAATQGPRLETVAEIDRLERDGADVVGMTAMPEAALAREVDIAYAAINVVANMAAGRGTAEISLNDINANLKIGMKNVHLTLERALSR